MSDEWSISIEGGIGVGKSTLSEALAKALSAPGKKVVYFEEQTKGNPFLEDFYSQPAKFAFDMQMYMLATRNAMHHVGTKNGCRTILDRDLSGDRGFGLTNAWEKRFQVAEFEAYEAMYWSFLRRRKPPTVVLRLRASVETLQKRIATRNRGCESGIPDSYLVLYERALDQALEELKSVHPGVHILEVPYDTFPSVDQIAAKIRPLLK